MFREMSTIGYLLILSLLLELFALSENKICAQTPQEYLDLLNGSLLLIKGTNRFYIIRKGSVKMVNGREQHIVTSSRKLFPNESPKTSQYLYRQVFQKGKGRIEFLDGPKGFVKNYIVYDSETEKGWTPSQHTATIARPVRPPAGLDGIDYRECFRTVIGNVPFLKCFRERGNTRVEVKREGNLVVLHSDPITTTKPSVDLPNFGLRATIDPQHGFIPIVLEMLKTIDGKLMPYTRRTVTNWKDLGGGVWAPTRVVSQHFDLDPQFQETFGQVSDEVVMEVDLNRSSWNKDIPEETFELPLPKGATVVDFRRNVRYVTGEDDPGKNLDSLAAHAQELVPINTGYPLPSNPWLLRALIGVSILLLALIGFWVFVRQRGKRIAGA
jgi:hypothetical protein